MNTPHKHADLIKKWADGAIIQYKTPSGHWVTPTYPSWDKDTEYRVKPELVVIEGFGRAIAGVVGGYIFTSTVHDLRLLPGEVAKKITLTIHPDE